MNSLTIDEIRYNRVNWRDLNKDKAISRQAYKELFQQNIGESEGYYKYAVQKAKKFVRQLHPFSEIHRFPEYPGLQAHHIFMESEYPEIADYPENIICITPNQHFYRACTRYISKLRNSKVKLGRFITKHTRNHVLYALFDSIVSLMITFTLQTHASSVIEINLLCM